ncbi:MULTISPECIES: hypothetical protein [unclassified Rhizobium]|nr:MULTISPECIES: hypothetical protein [unclassified Rhizobium]MBB3291342.1 hypothetical protein [Rhizobium sp. BK252]MBB3406082.1 hypothetical protein [Rhizobium sp. BK289]MBB3418652.1 hypothetical protein [Rhizobium sp. BK284]MBB3486547.1 hypothetical protein [Rhizobium sp. BK347]
MLTELLAVPAIDIDGAIAGAGQILPVQDATTAQVSDWPAQGTTKN